MSVLASASSLEALALPISFEAELRRAWASCRRVLIARSSSSLAMSPAESGSSPRRLRPASKAAGFSRMALMSNMEIALTAVNSALGLS